MAFTYVHRQTMASDTWNINHNLGKEPAVTIVDLCGKEVDVCGVDYIDINNLTIKLSHKLIGKAYLN